MILNVIIALFLYEVILKSIALIILKTILKDNDSKYTKESFKEKLENKINENRKNKKQ